MGKFKVICCQCGSDKIIEKSEKRVVDNTGNHIVYGEGIQRRCQDCSNEDFSIFKTWAQ